MMTFNESWFTKLQNSKYCQIGVVPEDMRLLCDKVKTVSINYRLHSAYAHL